MMELMTFAGIALIKIVVVLIVVLTTVAFLTCPWSGVGPLMRSEILVIASKET